MTSTLQFDAPWSAGLKIISLVCGVLLVFASTIVAWNPALHGIERLLLLLAGPAGIFLAALFMVRGYELTPSELRIGRLLWNSRIPLVPLTRVEIDPRVLRASVRIGGNGGFLSYTGWYYNRRLGRYRMLVTDPQRSVVLHFVDRRPIVVSPEDPMVFARAARVCAGLPAEAAEPA